MTTAITCYFYHVISNVNSHYPSVPFPLLSAVTIQSPILRLKLDVDKAMVHCQSAGVRSFIAAALLISQHLACVNAHKRCSESTDMYLSKTARAESTLERHSLSSSHGDVCRTPALRGFFCPAGCKHIDSAPYCVEKLCGHIMPCRVAEEDEGGDEEEVMSLDSEVRNLGNDCHSPCFGVSGCCEQDFCGPAGACCKIDDPDSAGAVGCNFGKLGCNGHHCCVRAHSPS